MQEEYLSSVTNARMGLEPQVMIALALCHPERGLRSLSASTQIGQLYHAGHREWIHLPQVRNKEPEWESAYPGNIRIG